MLGYQGGPDQFWGYAVSNSRQALEALPPCLYLDPVMMFIQECCCATRVSTIFWNRVPRHLPSAGWKSVIDNGAKHLGFPTSPTLEKEESAVWYTHIGVGGGMSKWRIKALVALRCAHLLAKGKYLPPTGLGVGGGVLQPKDRSIEVRLFRSIGYRSRILSPMFTNDLLRRLVMDLF